MKNIFKIFLICLLVASCDDTESVTFDGTTAIGFGVNIVELSIPEGGITTTIPITSTTTSPAARNFSVSVVDTSVDASDYSIGTATIPANSYEGTLDVTFNYDGLEDFVLNNLTLAIQVAGSGFPPVTFNFLKEYDITTFVCPDLSLSIVADNWASETSWDVKDSSGTIVESGGPYDDGTAGTEYTANMTLAGGDYTFTIYDAYGDGLSDGTNIGTYNLFCAAQDVVSYASGSGSFADAEGFEETTSFTVVE